MTDIFDAEKYDKMINKRLPTRKFYYIMIKLWEIEMEIWTQGKNE